MQKPRLFVVMSENPAVATFMAAHSALSWMAALAQLVERRPRKQDDDGDPEEL